MERRVGALIHCANRDCQKPIIKDVMLVEGSTFMIRCYWCGASVRLISTFNTIVKKLVSLGEKNNGKATVD